MPRDNDVPRIGRQAPRRWGWGHGAVFYASVQGLLFGLGWLTRRALGRTAPRGARDDAFGDNAYYNGLRQPSFAPPDWAFAPAWTVNNILAIRGLLWVLNMPAGASGRRAFLALQGVSWGAYCAFNAAFFGLRSPINAAVLTDANIGLTVASVWVALTRLKDPRAALSLSTLLPWLLLAGPTATALAAWNRDDLYRAGPFVEPPPGWVKRRDE